MPLFHGTSAGRAKRILEEGLRPQGSKGISDVMGLAGPEAGLAFTTLSPSNAANYAMQQVGLERAPVLQRLLGRLGVVAKKTTLPIPEKLRSGIQNVTHSIAGMTPSETRPLAPVLGSLPGGKRVLRMDVPRTSIREAVAPELHQPIMRRLRQTLRSKHPLLEQVAATSFMHDVPVAGGVPAAYVRGSPHYQGVSLQELREHGRQILTNPVEVGRDVLRSTLGVSHRPGTLLKQAPAVGVPSAVQSSP